MSETAPPCTMVIFGAAGDLTKRLVVPALYTLALGRQLRPLLMQRQGVGEVAARPRGERPARQ